MSALLTSTSVFFPNNDVSPSRRLRIQRAREYGAQWTREWTENITHVIVDKGLLFQDVITHLKVSAFPVRHLCQFPLRALLNDSQANVALVNETYPSDCIRFRSVLSPLQARFRVDGTPEAREAEEPNRATEPSAPDSLPLKPSKRALQAPETSQSSIENHSPARPFHSNEVVSERVQEAPSTAEFREEPWERDVLDDMIQEAKATSHLVGYAGIVSLHISC